MARSTTVVTAAHRCQRTLRSEPMTFVTIGTRAINATARRAASEHPKPASWPMAVAPAPAPFGRFASHVPITATTTITAAAVPIRRQLSSSDGAGSGVVDGRVSSGATGGTVSYSSENLTVD